MAATATLAEQELGAWRALLDAHALVVEHVEDALQVAELPPLSWYDVLWTLHRAPEGRARMFEVAEGVVMSRSGLTRLVDRIEAAGLIERRQCPSDRRGQHVVLTEAGSAMLGRMWPVYAAAVEEHFARHVADCAALAAALAPVAEAARASRTPCDGACAPA
jgi:DNA-binding MarR family transcriptional regulator